MAKPDNVVCEDGVCHIDFSKKKNAGQSSSGTPSEDAAKIVEEKINNNKVVIFSKTYCPYCDKAKALFKSKNVAFDLVELDSVKDGEKLHAYLKEKTNQSTVPNIFVSKQHVGGFSDLSELDTKGELAKLLQ
ncbi:thioredoxin-like protein [Fimicolochytrium jonesii]|uniref:thioredoxin-like protein n=1 Tax=Fimicolochytrium jonesii TaxID=1396493 RepID=UPI0022FE8F22|nr:thioredoxin-like protein [Fimicolochytrium jonesii]KAI8824246.1 thioredoxin-like protein [Fimicolochytrium jonesii]